MKTILIIANGRENSKEFITSLAKRVDFVIGVDGGMGILLKYQIKADIAIGDFDSLDSKLLKELKKKKIPIMKFPKDKDFSDTELAIRFAIKEGFQNFILTGMLGKRTDHLLFNISTLLFLNKQNKHCVIKEEDEEIYITSSIAQIDTKIGEIISIYPLTMQSTILETKGLKYELKNYSIKKYRTLTLSNIATSEKAIIKVKSGTVLIIKEKLK
jgi:thiamine pyrophosphokinase